MNNEIIETTERNVKRHLESKRKAFFGMFLGEVRGGFCKIRTKSRSYHVDYIIDDKMERFFVDAYPQITCEKPYRYMMHAYVNEKTSTFKSGRIDIDEDNGEVKIRIESSFTDQAVSMSDIDDMEHVAIQLFDSLEKRLDRMAHGVYFNDDDPELMGAAERYLFDMKKRLSALDDDSDESFDDLIESLKAGVGKGDGDDDSPSGDAPQDGDSGAGGDGSPKKPGSFDDLFPKDDGDT